MAIDLGLRIMQLLDSIGIKGGSYLESKIKKVELEFSKFKNIEQIFQHLKEKLLLKILQILYL